MTLTSSQAIEALDKISKSDYGEVDKVQVRKAVDKLVSRLETPWESLVYIGWSMVGYVHINRSIDVDVVLSKACTACVLEDLR